MVRHSPHVGTRSSLGGVNMMPTAELLVVETTRSAACPKQLSTKRYRRERKYSRSSKKCPTPLLALLTSRIPEMPGKGPPACADGSQVLLPRALCSGTIPATTFPRLQAAVRANRLMDDPRFRWRGEGGSRPRVAPRIPPRASRATKADTWRAFPPKTSGPAARP
jgi:hypothetical protein